MSADGEKGYSIGHQEGALAFFRRIRTAERCCGFFRSHVRDDSEILDCGCGPGSVTVGLAQWAPNGRVVGIDVGGGQLEAARTLARGQGLSNVAFQQGDILALPFDDESFDLVFAQAVFIHIPNHEKALSEIRRLLRPGGHVALREPINDCSIFWPDDPVLRELARLWRLGAQRSGGNPDVGRELSTLLHQAGFIEVFLTFTFEQPARPEERAEYFGLTADLMSGDLGTLAVSEGWIAADRLTEVVARFRGLADDPGAISALPFGQAIGRKPA